MLYGFLNHLLGLVGIGPRKWLSSLDEVLPSLALVNVWVRLGFDTMIFLAALQAIPGESTRRPPSTAPAPGGASGP